MIDRLSGFHDRADDLFDRIRQCRYTIPDKTSEMILYGNAAYFREPLIDLQVATIWRQAREADRCGVVHKLEGRLMWKENHFRCAR